MSRTFDNNSSNYLSLGSLSKAASNDWSFAAYVKPDTTSTLRGVVSIGDVDSPGTPRAALGTNGANGHIWNNISSTVVEAQGGSPGTGSWVLLVGTINNSGNETKIYVGSNTAADTDITSFTPNGTMDRIVVGNYPDSTPEQPFDGLIAQVAIWEGLVLSTTDVQSLLDANTTAEFGAVQSGSLLCHYPLNNTNLSDETSSLSDLSVTGTVTASTDDPLVDISLVDGDDIVGATQTPWTITGTGFGAD